MRVSREAYVVRVLITGGAGCLGSNIVEHLLPQGHEILVIDNFATSRREGLPESTGLKVVEATINNRPAVFELFEDFRPSHVIHAAASYKDPNDWAADIDTNCHGTVNVACAAQDLGVEKFINLQTVLVYGRPQNIPIPIDHPLNPTTSYGISKLAGENYISMLGEQLPVISLRIANVIAPRLCIGPIPTFYTRLKQHKGCYCTESVRDFLDIADFLSLLDHVLHEPIPSGAYNVSTGLGHTVKEIFDATTQYLGIELKDPVPIVPVGDDDIATVILDPSYTEQTMGWRAKIRFEDSLRSMLEWYDEHGVTDVYSHLKVPPNP